MDPGLELRGKQLAKVPPNAGNDFQIATLNDVIDLLNSNSQDVVKSGNTTLTYGSVADDGTISVDYTMVTIQHNLGYKPRAYVYLNNTGFIFHEGEPDQETFRGVDTPLPTFLNGPFMSLGGMGGGGDITVEYVGPPFWDWLYYLVDAENLYIIYAPNAFAAALMTNEDPGHYTVPLTYELHRRPTDQ